MRYIIKPKIKNFLCASVNPSGCKKNIDIYIKRINKLYKKKIFEKKNVLILGSSSGYGLFSSLLLSFGYKYNVINVFNEKQPVEKNNGSFGWYNSFFSKKMAEKESIYFKNFNIDAFSIKSIEEIINVIKNDIGKIDILIYSLCAGKCKDIFSEKIYKSVLKPVGKDILIKELDFENNGIKKIFVKKASNEEIDSTKKIMGGFFWKFWIDSLIKENILNYNFKTIAYSYQSSLSNKIYKNGTIGAAKKHLLKTAFCLNSILKKINGSAFIVYNEAIITKSSMVIPGVPLYLAILNNLRKDFSVLSDSINDLSLLFRIIEKEKKCEIYLNKFEKKPSVEIIIKYILKKIDSKNISKFLNIHEFKREYLKIYGHF